MLLLLLLLLPLLLLVLVLLMVVVLLVLLLLAVAAAAAAGVVVVVAVAVVVVRRDVPTMRTRRSITRLTALCANVICMGVTACTERRRGVTRKYWIDGVSE